MKMNIYAINAIVLICLATCLPEQLSNGAKRFLKERMVYNEPKYSDKIKNPTVSIFIHASVGIFKKKKPVGTNETWGYGREIMEETLMQIQTSGLLFKQSTNIYVTLLGNDADRQLATSTLQRFNTSGNVFVHLSGSNLFVSELPTLKAIHMYSQRVHGQSPILYFHTKGMRNNGKYSADWRRYAQFFLIEKHHACLEALSAGYSTCGVQLNAEEYVGNFWWSKADWLAKRELELLNLGWHMGNRYVAEDFLLSPTVLSNNDIQQHFCILYISHNLYDCPTPRSIYEDVLISIPGTKVFLRTQKVSVPTKQNVVTCPRTINKKSTQRDSHGGVCLQKVTLATAPST